MKGKAAKPGVGSGLQNAKTIATEKTPKKSIGYGLPNTYFGNSRSIDTARGKK
jgi:hypothetical protein